MLKMLLEILLDIIKDNWLILPLLYVCYLVIEYFERRESDDDKLFFGLQKYGPLLGTLLGVLPQCGFSIIAAMLFASNYVSLGTMIAVFIATSDEAIPVMLSNPSMYPFILKVLCSKIVIAIVSGYVIDLIVGKKSILSFDDIEEEEESEDEEENADASCPCCYTQYPAYVSAFLRSLKIFAYIFVVSFIMSLIIELVSEDVLSTILLKGTILQPIVAAIFGFIPNCAASVVLTTLFVNEQLAFNSLMAGLITNAGMGLIVLYHYGVERKKIISVITILLMIAILSAIVIGIVF